jgi:hypothetical protein
LYTPAALQFTAPTRTDVIVITNSDGSLRQVNAPQTLADIPVPPTTNGYVINFYYPSQVGSLVGGVYQLTGTPFTTWLVTNSNPSTINQILISETNFSYGSAKQWNYAYGTNTGTWSVQSLGGIVQENMSITNLNASTYEIINTVQSSNGPVVQQVAKTYQTFVWSASTNVAVTQVAVGSSSAPEITTYTYWDPATFGAGSTILASNVVHPDGSWEYYSSYDANGNPLTVYSSFNDVTPANYSSGKETVYTYNPTSAGVSGSGDNGTANPNVPRLTITYLQSQEISRSYTVFPSVSERLDIQCTVAGAAWNASGNLVTTNLFYTSGANQFALQSVVRPDGTMTTYNYITNSSYQTNITVTGQPNSTYAYIVDGVSNVTVLNTAGYRCKVNPL